MDTHIVGAAPQDAVFVCLDGGGAVDDVARSILIAQRIQQLPQPLRDRTQTIMERQLAAMEASVPYWIGVVHA